MAFGRTAAVWALSISIQWKKEQVYHRSRRDTDPRKYES